MKTKTFDNKDDYDFENRVDWDEAWFIFERYALGHFEVVADYHYKSLRQFLNSSIEFVRVKRRYIKDLEQQFNIELM